MKKMILLIPILGLSFSCSTETKQEEKSTEVLQEKEIEMIETSVEKLDETIKKSEIEMEKSQNALDSLLNDI